MKQWLLIDRELAHPISRQISDKLRAAIASGEIAPGERMIPTRSLALDLGVSRSTLIEAYSQLVSEGYLNSVKGSGYFVSDTAGREVSTKGRYARRTQGPPVADIENEVLRAPGRPDVGLFPKSKWARTIAQVARTTPDAFISHDSAFGDMHLRLAIADYLQEWRAYTTAPANIIITTGSLESLEVLLSALTVAGDGVGLEDPGYPPLRHLVTRLSRRVHSLRLHREGPEVPHPECSRDGAPRLIVLTPSNQYPLGGVIPLSRRAEFVSWARYTEGWIIEDDYDSEFRYAGQPVLPMAATNDPSRTIYLGTFNKTISSGLRLGFMVVPDALVDTLASALRSRGTRASATVQRPLAHFINSGELVRHLRRTRRIYGERRRTLMCSLNTEAGELCEYADHHAGMHLTVTLVERHDDRELSSMINSRGRISAPLSQHYFDCRQRHGLLLGFCHLSSEEITEYVRALGHHLNKARTQTPPYGFVRS